MAIVHKGLLPPEVDDTWLVEDLRCVDVGPSARTALRNHVREGGVLTPEELICLPPKEQVLLKQGDLEGWEDVVARSVAMHRETGGAAMEEGRGNTRLAAVKAELDVFRENFRSHLESGDIWDVNANVALWLSMADAASSYNQMKDALIQAQKLMGMYVETSRVLNVNLDAGSESSVEAMLERMESKHLVAPEMPKQKEGVSDD